MFKKSLNKIKDLLSYFWFPGLLLVLFLFLASRISNYKDPEAIKVVLGIMLGVSLGFIADIIKRSLDDYSKKEILRKTALALLKDDAEKVYRSMQSIKEMRANVAAAPKDIQEAIMRQLPPELELRYWKRLNQENDFLLLGSTEPFKTIFSELWEIEKINEQRALALTQNEQAYMFAMAMYNTSLEDNLHQNLLKNFMSEHELTKFVDGGWKEIHNRRA